MSLVYRGLLPDGRSYIGSTRRKLSTRISEHRHYFKIKKYKMYDNINCNFDEIKWFLLESCNEDVLLDRENYYIIKFDSIKNGLNSAFASQGAVGMKHTRESIDQRIKTRLNNMPFFKISKKNGDKTTLITNSYDRASVFTNQSRDNIRRKLRNGKNCSKFNYEYLIGGGLSQ